MARVCISLHLSGIVNGFTHVIALAGDASAVAIAAMSAVAMPKYLRDQRRQRIAARWPGGRR